MDTILKISGIILSVVLMAGSCRQIKKTTTSNKAKSAQIIDGVSFVSSPRKPNDTTFAAIKQVNAGWVSLMPYAFCYKDSSEVWYDVERQWWGEKTEGIVEYVKRARQQGLKVMLKPHLWIIRGGFTGKLSFDQPQKWEKWEASYKKYLLHHARLADSLNLEMFCLGTELESFVKARPQFWVQFIKDVKAIYKGKLTYAANWDEYKRFPYWAQMDYIGVDAYFPLSAAKTPTSEGLTKGWQRWLKEMQQIQAQHKKPILFTEFGYRSIYHTAKEPWVSTDWRQPVDFEGQSNALEALFQNLSPQPWFAGGFIWKWFGLNSYYRRINSKTNTGYTPQGKPAEKVLKKWYAKFGEEVAKK